ncbi:MAG: FAD-dependent oxidoreductase [Burkholderiales bacterium]|nr:FAD-dependent oxidoreductase [Burkholderiales bacterium]
MSEAYPHLFAPFDLAGRRLRNRVVHAAMSLRYAADQGASARLVEYHASRARGGAAMIITEPVAVAPHQPARRVIAWDDSRYDDLARWAAAVETHDCRLLAQVQDVGRGRHVPGRAFAAIAPSALPDDLSWSVPRAMSTGEIEAFVASAAQSCARLARAGFSGVEVVAAHGHLIHQFLSARSNRRDDRFGGDLTGRARLLVDLCAAIRAACPRDFILAVKLPGDDGVAGSVRIDEAAAIARHLCARVRPDLVSYAQGSHHQTLEMHIPDGSYARVPYRDLARALRAATPGVPLMALGRITDPAEAEGLVAAGDAELVGLGRALVTDAAWPRKAAAGLARDIRYCVSCNTCWRTIVADLPLACDNNPRAGTAGEEAWQPPRAPAPKHVVVVGAGIAGLEAAATAAARGHRVTVFGASTEVGGKTRLHASLPIAEALSSIYDHQFAAAARSGVRFLLGARVDAADVLAATPDAVVLATGSTMLWPECLDPALGAAGLVRDLRETIAALGRRRRREAGTAVVLDMDGSDGTYAAAERLADLFARVVLVTPRERIAEDTALVTRQRVLRRCHERGIAVRTLTLPRVAPDFADTARLACASIYGGEAAPIEDVALLTYATPRVPDDALAAPLAAAGVAVRRIGDCKVARGVLDATAEGFAAGMAL